MRSIVACVATRADLFGVCVLIANLVRTCLQFTPAAETDSAFMFK